MISYLILKPSLLHANRIIYSDLYPSEDKIEKGKWVKRKFPFVLRGEKGEINLKLSKVAYDFFKNIPREVICFKPACPSRIFMGKLCLNGFPCPEEREFILAKINDQLQDRLLKVLVEKIRKITPKNDDRLRIAVSLVQMIPYDWDSYKSGNLIDRFPYQVLYDKKGVCEEKSRLLAYLLSKLGYGVVLFIFQKEQHMAVGVKCPVKYSYRRSGYCFIEVSRPEIITYSKGKYVGSGRLKTNPQIYKISDGRSFLTVKSEFKDALLLDSLERKGPVLAPDDYRKWLKIQRKYGIESGNEISDK